MCCCLSAPSPAVACKGSGHALGAPRMPAVSTEAETSLPAEVIASPFLLVLEKGLTSAEFVKPQPEVCGLCHMQNSVLVFTLPRSAVVKLPLQGSLLAPFPSPGIVTAPSGRERVASDVSPCKGIPQVRPCWSSCWDPSQGHHTCLSSSHDVRRLLPSLAPRNGSAMPEAAEADSSSRAVLGGEGEKPAAAAARCGPRHGCSVAVGGDGARSRVTKCACGERGEGEIIHPVLAAWQQLKAKPDPVPSASPTLGDADPQGMPLPHPPAVRAG